MQCSKNHERLGAPFRRYKSEGWRFACGVLLLTGTALAVAQQNQPAGQPGSQPTSQQSSQPAANGNAAPADPGPRRPWTNPSQLAVPGGQNGTNFDAINADRRKQIAEDSAKLLKLATDLKAEVDKSTKDTLSLSVIRKADEIEKLAHTVKEKMKTSSGGN